MYISVIYGFACLNEKIYYNKYYKIMKRPPKPKEWIMYKCILTNAYL
jgi:hypothetical protein